MSSSVLIDKSSVSLYFSTVSIIKPCKNLLGEDVLRDLSLVLCAMREGAFAEASFAFQCMAGWLACHTGWNRILKLCTGRQACRHGQMEESTDAWIIIIPLIANGTILSPCNVSLIPVHSLSNLHPLLNM